MPEPEQKKPSFTAFRVQQGSQFEELTDNLAEFSDRISATIAALQEWYVLVRLFQIEEKLNGSAATPFLRDLVRKSEELLKDWKLLQKLPPELLSVDKPK